MTADEVRIGEAVASLTARLESYGVEEPLAKAHDYVTAMLREGWRPRAARVEVPSWNPDRTLPPADLMAAMRADIAAAQHPTTSPETGEIEETA